MKKISFKNKRFQTIIITAIFILMLAVVLMFIISNKIRQKENTIFSIDKIIIYNSAGIDNNPENQSLTNLTINQFSDLSIYINNNITEPSQLDAYNTIKSMYIDNITISTLSDSDSPKVLNYKNSLALGKYINLEPAENNTIYFDVIKNNLSNTQSQYDYPTFYTDCTNPITLGYINKNVINNYSISDNSNKVSFNSKVLKNTDMNLDDISTTIQFTIHIINNAGHKLSCKMKIDITFDNDFVNNGYSYISIPLSGDEYKFKRK